VTFGYLALVIVITFCETEQIYTTLAQPDQAITNPIILQESIK